MAEVEGKAGIKVKILCDSISEQGNRLTTYELVYPRIVHQEILTHKMLCSNSASSRAIPFAKMVEQLQGKPVRFGQANPGMQDKGEDFYTDQLGYYGKNDNADDEWFKLTPEESWEIARKKALIQARRFYNAGYAKQVYNRLIEPFQMMKTVISGTEWENFFWLRNHDMADPTLEELARCMYEVRTQSNPQLLKPGQWHLPYIDMISFLEYGDGNYGQCYGIRNADESITGLNLEQAIKVSCARTAAVSFRNEDYGLEKCLEVYDKLIKSDRVHASATQHCATPMKPLQRIDYDDCTSEYINQVDNPKTWEDGISHIDRNDNLWSAQYKGWIMYRKLIPNENYTGELK